jgi:phage-related protein
MADKELILNVKTDISDAAKDTEKLTNELKDTNKEAKESIGNFQIMGVSINGLKTAFKSAAGQAKFLFSSIKAGILSTGVGALLIAFGSLLTFFTRTKKGAELLERTFAGLGAAVDVIVDRVSKFGGAIVKLFQGDTKGALQDVKGAFKGIGDEIQREVDLIIELKRQSQELRDSERELRVETAERRAEIEGLKLIAEDLTKTEKERLDAAQKAFDIENELLDKRVANAEEAVRIQKEQVETSESLEEDLDTLADLEVALADIRIESTTKQIELNNKINGIKREAEAKEIAALKEIIDLENQRVGQLEEIPSIFSEEVELKEDLQKADDTYFNNLFNLRKSEKKTTEENKELQLAAYSQLAGALSSLAGENKELAIAQAIIDTYAGANAAFKAGGPVGFVTGAAIIAQGLANVQKMMEQDVGGGSGGGSVPTPTVAAPRTEIQSGAFTLEGGVEPEPARAYVVSDDITDSQNKLANIRRRATI